MATTTEPDSQGAHLLGATPFFASQHDQRLSYALYVPKDHTPDAAPLPLVVVQHGTGRSAEAYRNHWKQFAIEHRCVILTPLFPAGLVEPGELHNFKFLEYKGIRFDHELLHIVDEVGARFNTETATFYLHGFSGGGQFAHRFLYAAPDRLAGVSIGAPGRITELDDTLPWWLGTGGFAERFGVPIDLDAVRRVPVQMVVGGDDVETWEIANVGGPNWMDGVERTGRTRVERLETLRAGFVAHGIDVRFDVVPGVGHRGSLVIPVVQEFMADLLSRRAA
ncbi:PHB depolymerase family esterase [Actinophytocola oryzae]|uniref:Esterase/PHB depolymerase n=1 Tax=Actinophytocola oryzae TaxID=502181 RepID=A0A4R7VLA5_9PSEU|nr:PHB depolymerase family esterase [Actinophytocola oryzae]TDV49977.1 esterase/PHB depolymerase [Actinophytocola oryzae]